MPSKNPFIERAKQHGDPKRIDLGTRRIRGSGKSKFGGKCSFPGCSNGIHVLRLMLCVGHYGQHNRGEELRPLRKYKYGADSVREMSDVEIAWLSGLLEGEGCFLDSRGCMRIQFHSTDKDVVDKVKNLTGGCGSVIAQFDPRGGRKPAWRWDVSGARAIAIMKMILPHMGARRSNRIKGIIEDYESKNR